MYVCVCYQICDTRAEEYGVEKVKCINDRYMCVSGAPEMRQDHATDMVHVSLSLSLSLASLSLSVFLLCHMHCSWHEVCMYPPTHCCFG